MDVRMDCHSGSNVVFVEGIVNGYNMNSQVGRCRLIASWGRSERSVAAKNVSSCPRDPSSNRRTLAVRRISTVYLADIERVTMSRTLIVNLLDYMSSGSC